MQILNTKFKPGQKVIAIDQGYHCLYGKTGQLVPGKLYILNKNFGKQGAYPHKYNYWSINGLSYGEFEDSFKPAYEDSLKLIKKVIENAKNS